MVFRYQSLLNIRRGHAHRAQSQFAAIYSRLAAQQISLEALDRAGKNYKSKFDRRLNQNMDVNTRVLYDDYLTGLKRKQSFWRSTIAETNAQLETRRKEFISALTKQKALEAISNRDSLLAKKQARKRKINLIDETAILWRGQFS